jgi:hypothetical protein
VTSRHIDTLHRLVAVIGLLAACVQPSAPAGDADAAEQAPSAPATEPAPLPVHHRAYVGVDGVGLHILDENGWRLLLQTRAPVRAMLKHEGRLYVLSAFGVQRVDEGGRAEDVATIDRDTYTKIGEPTAFESTDGREFRVTGLLGVARYAEGRWQFPSDVDTAASQTLALPPDIPIADGWPGQPLRSVTRDASGRVWVGTNNGFTIIAPDGQFAEYPISQLGEIAGPVGPILVEGNGPPPPTLGRVRNGGLKGTIVVRDGDTKRPLPGVRLELCSRTPPGGDVPPDPNRSPCAGVEPTHTTTTDGEGGFEFQSLPIDHYYFGVEIDGRWARGQPKALNMRAGMSGNVGKLTVAVPE